MLRSANSVGEIETEKETNKMEKAKKPYKIGLLRWSLKNVKNKKWIFEKIDWHCLCQEGRKTRIFVHTICFGQKFFATKTV